MRYAFLFCPNFNELELKKASNCMFLVGDESYVRFFSYLYTAKPKAPVVRVVRIAIYMIGVY